MDDKRPGWNLIFFLATMAVAPLVACARTPFSQGGDAAQGERAVDTAVAARDAAGRDTTLPDVRGPEPDAMFPIPDASLPLADTHVPAPDASLAFPEVPAPGLDSTGTRSETPPSLVSLLGGRSFELRSNLPAPTLDPTCTARSTTNWYTLDFSTDILTVTISELSARATMPMHGTVGPESDKITYHINDAFAGGTLTLEWDQGLVVAQLTLYGSGVPVVACLRAPLAPQP